jgi:leucyl aminopeptidase
VPDDAVGVLVGPDGPVPDLGFDRAALRAAGFTGAPGTTLVLPAKAGAPRVVVGVGDPAVLDESGVRDAAAAFAGTASWSVRPALDLAIAADPAVAAQAAVEGILLVRYRFSLHSTAGPAPLAAVTVITADGSANAGAQRGKVLAGATALARDLANCPPAHLTAVRMAELAEELGTERGLTVEVFDRDALLELGCGGLLAVNGGSAEPHA